MNRPLRVLLVDNSAAMRQAIRALISTTHDMVVIGDTADGDGAIKMARHEFPDVAVLDLSTRPKDRLLLIAKLVELLPDLHILLLTDEVDANQVQGALEVGAKAYLPKGASPQDLLNAIRAMHECDMDLRPSAIA